MATAKKSKAALKKEELARNIKHFKASDDVTNFYQYVQENNLRYESMVILKEILSTKKNPKKTRTLH